MNNVAEEHIAIGNMWENEHWSLTKDTTNESCLCGNVDFGRKNSAQISYYLSYDTNAIYNVSLCLQINALLELEDIIECVELLIGGHKIGRIFGHMFDILYSHYDLSYCIRKIHGVPVYHYEIPLPFDLFVKNKVSILPMACETRFQFTFADRQKSDHHILESSIKYDTAIIKAKKDMKLPQQLLIPMLEFQQITEEILGNKQSLKITIKLPPQTCSLYWVFIKDNKIITDCITKDNMQLHIRGHDRYQKYESKLQEKGHCIQSFSNKDYCDAVIECNFDKIPEIGTKLYVYAFNHNTMHYTTYRNGYDYAYIKYSNWGTS